MRATQSTYIEGYSVVLADERCRTCLILPIDPREWQSLTEAGIYNRLELAAANAGVYVSVGSLDVAVWDLQYYLDKLDADDWLHER